MVSQGLGDVVMSSAIRLEVRSGYKSWLALGVELLLDAGSGPPGPITTPSGPGPRVVAIVGDSEHIVQQYRSHGAAVKDLPRLSEELQRLGSEQWARLHGVPVPEGGF